MLKLKLFISILFLFIFQTINAQTFNGTGGAIPDDGLAPTCFPISVTGVGTINQTYGLASVCIEITHTWDSDLEISLNAPDGTNIPLSIQNGGSGDNFTGTCFTGTALISIGTGTAPFTGSFLPDAPLGSANNGQNANGVWTLCIQDVFAAFTGTLNSWSITFNNTPAPPPPVVPPCISSGQVAGNDCVAATPVCNFNGYCGNTSSAFTIDTWTELTTAFCGSIDNNSFITFVASSTTASFNVWVTNSTDGFGIQMMFYDGGCGSGPVNSYGCYNQIQPSAFPTAVSATGLTPGNTYYLMFDGYAGDVCDYTIAPVSGVNILAITPPAASICIGGSIALTASGGNGTFTWTGAGLNTYTGAIVTATPTLTTTYTVTSADPGGNCPITKDVIVTITTTPDPPTATSPLTLCQNSLASPLAASGTSLLWYNTATGGTGNSSAPTPNTLTAGSTTYYVSQTLACGESVRVPILVNVISSTPLPTVTNQVIYCQSSIATALTATGSSLLWYTSGSGGTGSPTAPIPSTSISGNTTYYVTQSGTCGESPMAAITVTINSITAAPTVTSPVIYCQGVTTSQLTATGNALLWYNTLTGGTGNTIAPTPSSASSGNTTYYVSQTVSGCEGTRASIVVTILTTTPAPTATSPITYCQGSAAVPLTAIGTGLLWYTSATGGTGTATGPTPSTAASGSITYYVSQTTSCGESPRIPVVVVVNSIPNAPIVGPGLSYCIGTTASPLTAAGSNLLWYTSAMGGLGTTTLTPSTSTVGTVTYYVSQTILNCESPRASIIVTITGLPAAPTITTAAFIYCQNSIAQTLSATGTSLLWYNVPTGGTGTATAPTPSTATAGTTTYYVTQTLSCGESPRASIVVTINPTPLAPIVTTPVVYCQGVIPVALSANGNNLLWYTISSGGTGNAAAPIPSTSTVGSTDYFVSATTGICEGPRSLITVTVNLTPAAPIISSPVNYCQGNSSTSLAANGTNLLWYNVASGGTGLSASPIPSTATPGNANYYVSQTVGICEGPRSTINVIVLNIPNLGANQQDTICFGGTFNATTIFNTTGLTIHWTHNGTDVTNPGSISETGIYQIEVTNANNCSDTALFNLNIRPPVLANAGHDTIAIRGAEHQLFATGGDTYQWYPISLLDPSYNPSGPVQMATLNNDQLFIVTAYNTIGCSDKDSVFIRVYDGPTYYIPKAFSPDGDGLNDIFRPIPVGISNTEYFKVFNRLGELIFSTNKWLRGWDGTYLNRKQPVGTYVWMIKGTDRNGKPVVMKGTVLIVK